ncbi:MAG: hypothetical protein KGH98_00785 [Candidatus Micrarchaeota archaeon]|nr:hypothetical protein [Candidatus Micrarchaeota archaeon]
MQKNAPQKSQDEEAYINSVKRKADSLVKSILSNDEKSSLSLARELDEMMWGLKGMSKLFRDHELKSEIKDGVISAVLSENVTSLSDSTISLSLAVENIFALQKMGVISFTGGTVSGNVARITMSMLAKSPDEKFELAAAFKELGIPNQLLADNPSFFVNNTKRLADGLRAIKPVMDRQGVKINFVDNRERLANPGGGVSLQKLRATLESQDANKIESFLRGHGIKPSRAELETIVRSIVPKRVKQEDISDEQRVGEIIVGVNAKAKELTGLILEKKWDEAERSAADLEGLLSHVKTTRGEFISTTEETEMKLRLLESVVKGTDGCAAYDFSFKRFVSAVRLFSEYGLITLMSDPGEPQTKKPISLYTLLSDPGMVKALLLHLEDKLGFGRQEIIAHPYLLGRPKMLLAALEFIDRMAKDAGIKARFYSPDFRNNKDVMAHSRLSIYSIKRLAMKPDKSQFISYINRFGLNSTAAEFKEFCSVRYGMNGDPHKE